MKKIISVLLVSALIFALAVVPSAAQGKYIYGDANDDGNVSSIDALIILQYSVELAELSETQQILADVTGDGSVNSADALDVLRYAIGTIEKFDKSYENTLKYEYVDSVFSGSSFTAEMSMDVEGENVGAVMTSDGVKSGISMTIKIDLSDFDEEDIPEADKTQLALFEALFGTAFDLEVRYFTDSDGTEYLIIPMLKAYCKIDSGEEDSTLDIIDTLFKEEFLYVGKTTEKKNNIDYVCEKYALDKDMEIHYLFNGNSLEFIDVGGTDIYTINKISSTAQSSLLSIPSGYTEDNSIADFGD